MLNTNYWKALSITTKWSLASIAIGAAAGLGQYLGLGRVELNPVFTGIIIAIISRNLGFLLQLMDTAKKQDEQLSEISLAVDERIGMLQINLLERSELVRLAGLHMVKQYRRGTSSVDSGFQVNDED